MPPLRKTVGFVEHPGADFAMHQRIGKSETAKLLRCDKDQAEVAQAQLVEHDPPLHWIEQAVEVAGAGNAARLEVVYLILHQRLQRRNHHGQAAIAVVAR